MADETLRDRVRQMVDPLLRHAGVGHDPKDQIFRTVAHCIVDAVMLAANEIKADLLNTPAEPPPMAGD